ncbi:MAG TPA: hypothetical protein VJN00_02390 [Steroidobacteraceae bacterium]|jgi:hypothetical protein|nr:hypothetical protein [Steroidobacteraceae bacterium]
MRSLAAILSVTVLIGLAGLLKPSVAQSQVLVTSADPPAAPQGTLSLDVTVSGSGFDNSAQVEFLITGTATPGGIIVRKVKVTGPKKLVATIDVADTAVIDKFDIQVSLSGGRKGKGTSLFSVLAKANDPCFAAVDFPSFIYFQTTAQQGTHVSDSSGQCTRFLKSGLSSIHTRFSYPVRDDLGNATSRGRVVWFGRDPADTFAGPRLQYHAMDFEVMGTTITPGPVHLVVDYGQLDSPEGGGNNGVCCGLDLSVDGRDLYVVTKAELRPEGYVNKVVRMRLPNDLTELDPEGSAAQTVVFEHDPGPRNDTQYTTDLDVNAANDLLYVEQVYDGPYKRVLRIDLDPDLVDTGSDVEVTSLPHPMTTNPHVGADVSSPASDLIALAIHSIESDCTHLTIMNGRTGTVLNEGSQIPAYWLSWANGKVLTRGHRKGCRSTDTIVEVDPLTGATKPLLSGSLPDGR